MQEQQLDTETILFEKCIEQNVNIDRYKLSLETSFQDGFILSPGSELRKVFGSNEKNDCINVVYEVDNEVKRFLWILKANLELTFSGEELWDVNEYKQEIIDRDENWFR